MEAALPRFLLSPSEAEAKPECAFYFFQPLNFA
jgi:hypothetical protein